MDIIARMQNGYCKDTILAMAAEIDDSPELFAELINVFFSGDKVLQQRTAWVMSATLEVQPQLSDPYIHRLIEVLEDDVHDAVRRCIIRSLTYVRMPEELHGKILNICFNFLQDRGVAIAVRVFSMSAIDRLSKTYPDIRNELVAYLKEEIDYGSAGFKSRARKIIDKKAKYAAL